MAGMQNVILKPRLVLGAEQDLRFSFAPRWNNHFDLNLIEGVAITGTGRTKDQLQEIRGDWFSLYTLYDKDSALQFNAGLYGELAEPLHRYVPFLAPSAMNGYALEENERIDRQELLGTDFNLRLDYDRLHSDFHNVIYLYGKRLGPNVLAYKPIFGLDWRNRAALIGTAEHPKLDFHIELKFFFARKATGSLFNSHDGLGGTKREMDLNYGLAYHFDRQQEGFVEAYSYNNLNRGASTTQPQDFRDGFRVGYRYAFN
jgi:hypothetical protein